MNKKTREREREGNKMTGEESRKKTKERSEMEYEI